MIRSKNWARNASSFIMCIMKYSLPSSFVVQLKNEKQNKYVGKLITINILAVAMEEMGTFSIDGWISQILLLIH